MTVAADGAALRRAVCAAPDDDLPRLVYADWLDEHGDSARAEFIRVQCEQARTPWMSARWRQLHRAADHLRRGHQAEWSANVDGVARYGYLGRGFVETVYMFSKRFVTHGNKLLDAEPVHTVRLIDLHAAAGAVPVREFVASPPVARLRGLDFGNSVLTFSEMEDISYAGTGPLAGLRDLTLEGGAIIGPLLVGLMRRLGGLKHLRVRPWDGGPARSVLEVLFREKAFERVETLDLSGTEVADAVPALAASRHAAGLTRLHLAQACDAAGIAALAASTTLRNLAVLDLTGCPVTDADVQALAGAVFAPTLKVLVVRQSQVPRANAKRFAGLFPQAEVVV